MYEYADEQMKTMNQLIAVTFGTLSKLPFDSLNKLQSNVEMQYQKLYRETKRLYLSIAKQANRDAGGDGLLDMAFVEAYMKSYDPVTRYQFKAEFSRKQYRFTESVIAVSDVPNKAFAKARLRKEFQTAMKLLSDQIRQGADTMVDQATLQAYRDNSVRKVMWITQEDERVCEECEERDKVIYDIMRVPPKPHLRCRCILKPIR